MQCATLNSHSYLPTSAFWPSRRFPGPRVPVLLTGSFPNTAAGQRRNLTGFHLSPPAEAGGYRRTQDMAVSRQGQHNILWCGTVRIRCFVKADTGRRMFPTHR